MIKYSHPKFMNNKIALWLWKKICCSHKWHLFDEVISEKDHYLYCDACETQVNISSTE